MRSIKSTLELSVIDQIRFGSFIVTTFTNLAEILVKGFLIASKIKAIPPQLTRNQKEQQKDAIRNSYMRKYFSTIVRQEISNLQSFSSKNEFLQVCGLFQKLRDQYRNEYTHGFYSYRADIPLETIRLAVERFVRFLEILCSNWIKLEQKVSERRALKILTYYCSFELRNPEQRWRKFNENLQSGIQRCGPYLGEDFDGVRKLLSLLELNVTQEDEFCSRIMGYDLNICSTITSILQNNSGQTERQIQSRIREIGDRMETKKLANILDDMASLNKIHKRYESGRVAYYLA